MLQASDSVAEPGRTPAAAGRKAGTWKVAYADFLTALVALFLVLWLVKGTEADARGDLAAFFRGDVAHQALVVERGTPSPGNADPSAKNLATSLTAALAGTPALAARIQDGDVSVMGLTVRLDLTDASPRPLFETGSARLTAEGEEIVAEAAQLLSGLPLAGIEVEGHTDAFPLAGSGASNWQLSTRRAAAAHAALLAGGLAPDRIQGVIGRSNTRPRLPAEPHHPVNRRITLVLHPAQ